MPESEKRSLKSVAFAVNHHVITGVAQRPVSNDGAVPDDHCVG